MSIFYRFQDSGLDDWDIANNYMQMGFRPGFGIQARELTQMQTILQGQITALAKRFLVSGSVIDAELQFCPSGGSLWSGSLKQGYIYIEPAQKQLGYFVYNNSQLNFSSIETDPTQQTNVYVVYEEVQVNPDGNPYPAGGGYARVTVDGLLKDNAQGYSNYSAPGGSRYQINILTGGSYVVGSGGLPTNGVNIAYYDPSQAVWKYIDSDDTVQVCG